MVFESLSRRLSRVFNLRYCCAAARYSGAAWVESLTLTVLPLAFVGKLEVGPVALGGVRGTGALGFAALHHSLQNCTFAETLDPFQASSEFQEALRVAFQGGTPCSGTDATFRNRIT